jgi:PepSY-associated TM region
MNSRSPIGLNGISDRPVRTRVPAACGSRRCWRRSTPRFRPCLQRSRYIPILWAPAEVSFGRERLFLVDVYSGKVLGEGSAGTRCFFQQVENWHRWLGTSSEHRAIGRDVTGVCNFRFLILVMSGPFLWMPRQWSWKNIRAAALSRGGLSGRARDFNRHNVIGIWCAVPLFLIVLSGVVMSYPWANNLLYRITGNPPPIQGNGQRPESGRARRGQPPGSNLAGLNLLWTRAERQVPDWRSITLRVPIRTRTVDVHDRHRRRRAAGPAIPTHAGPADGGNRPLGAVFELPREPSPPLLVSIPSHWRGRWDGGSDGSGACLRRRSDAGLDRPVAGVPPLVALEETRPASGGRFGKQRDDCGDLTFPNRSE